MLNLTFDAKEKGPFKILCLGAHCDDIEIGCGATLLQLMDQEKRNLSFVWIVFSCDQKRKEEALSSATVLLDGVENKTVRVKQFKDGFFPFYGEQIKEYFEELKVCFSPDLIFTHYAKDAHQDHRLISELAWNTFRDHMILEYEIPKYDGDMGAPNVFVQLNDELCRKKVQHILKHFNTQTGNHWFRESTFLSLMRIRGIESNAATGYAEGFYCRKIVLK
jgi:LmbE family N-acetylglucosaminyl deacetylase